MGLSESENVFSAKNCKKPRTGSSLPGAAREKVKTVKNIRKIVEIENRALILKVWPEVGPNGLKTLTNWTGPKLGPSPTYKTLFNELYPTQ